MLRLQAISPLRIALALGVAAGLAGCTSEPFVPTEPMALDGVTFTLEPEPQEHCDPNQPFAVKVQWDVIDWDVPRFDFRLGSSEGQLWARHNTARGEQTTELFGRPGLWFVMVDRESGLLVAANKVPPLICPEAPKQP